MSDRPAWDDQFRETEEERNERQRAKRLRDKERRTIVASDPRDPDYSRPGIFAHHNCWKCKDGTRLDLCPTPDRPGNCGYPHARND